jgi:hypothetical protein
MHGVDTADQYLAFYPFIRKTVKWPKEAFLSIYLSSASRSLWVFKQLVANVLNA